MPVEYTTIIIDVDFGKKVMLKSTGLKKLLVFSSLTNLITIFDSTI